MERQLFRTISLAAKEWRTRRVIFALVAVAAALLPLATLNDPLESGLFVSVIVMPALWGTILGATFLGREEYDSARAFLYLLPLPRSAILWSKLKLILWGLLAILLINTAWIYLRVVYDSHTEFNSSYLNNSELERRLAVTAIGWYVATSALLGAIALLVAMIMQVYCRTIILTLALSAVVTSSLMALLLGPLPLVTLVPFDVSTSLPLLTLSALILAALGAWLRYLFCTTAIQERASGTRTLFALMFSAVALEAAYTICFCNVRDLVFLVFGF